MTLETVSFLSLTTPLLLLPISSFASKQGIVAVIPQVGGTLGLYVHFYFLIQHPDLSLSPLHQPLHSRLLELRITEYLATRISQARTAPGINIAVFNVSQYQPNLAFHIPRLRFPFCHTLRLSSI